MATARSAYPSDPGNHPTQKLNTSQAAARNTSDKCLANKPATPPVVEMRLMCRSFGADSSNSRQADDGQFSSPTRQSPRIPAKASNAKGASTPCRLNFNALRRCQAASQGPSERKLAPLPWFQVGGSRAPKGAQGGEAHRGSGGCRPHAWERPVWAPFHRLDHGIGLVRHPHGGRNRWNFLENNPNRATFEHIHSNLEYHQRILRCMRCINANAVSLLTLSSLCYNLKRTGAHFLCQISPLC